MSKTFILNGEEYNPIELVATDWRLDVFKEGNGSQKLELSSESLGFTDQALNSLHPKVNIFSFVSHHFTGDMKNRLNIDEDGNMSINNETALSFNGRFFIPYSELILEQEKAEQDKLSFLGISDLIEGEHYKTRKGRIFKYLGKKIIQCKDFGRDGKLREVKTYTNGFYLKEVFKNKTYATKYIHFSKSLELIEHVPMNLFDGFYHPLISTYHITSEKGDKVVHKLYEYENTDSIKIIGNFQIIRYKSDYYIYLERNSYHYIYKKITSIKKVLSDIGKLGERFNIKNYIDTESTPLAFDKYKEESVAIGVEIQCL